MHFSSVKAVSVKISGDGEKFSKTPILFVCHSLCSFCHLILSLLYFCRKPFFRCSEVRWKLLWGSFQACGKGDKWFDEAYATATTHFKWCRYLTGESWYAFATPRAQEVFNKVAEHCALPVQKLNYENINLVWSTFYTVAPVQEPSREFS